MVTNPIRITDTTFRDAHQSLLATRLRTADMEPLAGQMDAVGFHSMEVWGGATFDSATRFLAEDPWERLSTLKGQISNTPLMMLLRGQNLLGYRIYADDVVDAFVEQAAATGIDVFRVFDSLNDERNLQRAADAVKKSGKHLQLTVCYSVTEEGRMGGAIYNLDYFVEKAKLFQNMGADSICLKDQGGLMAPYDAHTLVSTLKSVLSVPMQLHTHYTSGMASMTALKAIEAGIDILDTCLAPLALRTSQPAVEPIMMALRGTERDTGLDLEQLLPLGDELESILPDYSELMDSPRASVIDPRVLSHQIPGGMVSNLVSQLREAGAIDRLSEVLEEIPRTRKELGYPPLVTPMSQMVGSQAVTNVLFGRYKMISAQVRDYAQGIYGRPPAPLDPEVFELASRDDKRDAGPITGRPADTIDPELDQARDAVREISTDIKDVLTYALFPTTGLRFLKIKHGLEPVPEEMKPQSPRQKKARRDEETEQAATPGAQNAGTTPLKSPKARTFNVFVGDEFYQVEVDAAQGTVKVGDGASRTARTKSDGGARATTSRSVPADAEGTVVAPIPGIVLRYVVQVGQNVTQGDPVVVLESMRMENPLPSPITGSVTSLPVKTGTRVEKDALLAIIKP